MIYLKISTKLRKYLLRKYQQSCIIRYTCSIKCKYLKTYVLKNFIILALKILEIYSTAKIIVLKKQTKQDVETNPNRIRKPVLYNKITEQKNLNPSADQHTLK